MDEIVYVYNTYIIRRRFKYNPYFVISAENSHIYHQPPLRIDSDFFLCFFVCVCVFFFYKAFE